MNSDEQAGAMAIIAGMGIFLGIFGLVAHFFVGYCFKLIAEKTGNHETAGIWWVPIVNMLIPLRIAKKPGTWLLVAVAAGVLMGLSPILGAAMDSGAVALILYLLGILLWLGFVVLWIITWMEVAKARGKESWWGVIAVLVGIIGIPYLAFSDGGETAPATS